MQRAVGSGAPVDLNVEQSLLASAKSCRMACVSALCRRLKRLFSVEEKKKKKEDAEAARTREKNLRRDSYALAAKINGLKGKLRSKGNKFNNGSIRQKLRFSSSQSCSKESSCEVTPRPAALASGQLPATSRYGLEFEELEQLGNGQFGAVYRCLHRLDGCVYAVKRSRPLGRGEFGQRRATNEVQANARLSRHRHVVRYHSAWIEEGRLNIQQEYCEGGDLATLIAAQRANGMLLEEAELRRILRHVAEGLRYIHGTQLAHMDIKPDNIFIAHERTWTAGLGGEEPGWEVVYKIGDLGHATSTAEHHEPEDEGDCRYLSREILREDYADLTKADVFALGLTIYEAGGGGPLPKNGPAWHSIRNGNIDRLDRCSDDLNRLLKAMIHVDPKKRPTATDILQYEFLSSLNN